MSIKIKPIKLSLVLVSILLVSAIFLGASKQPEKINIGGHTSIFGTVLMIGEKMGIYAKHGLDATVKPVRSSKESMAAMAGGTLDVVLGTAAAGNLNLTAKWDIYIIADAGRIVPQFVVRKSLFEKGVIKTLSDLKGRRVSVPRAGSASWYAMNRILQSVQLGIEDIKPKYLRQRETIAALGAGHIDAAMLAEPNTTIAIQKGIAALFNPEEIAALFPKEGQQYAVLYTTGRMLKRPKVLRRFLKAYLESIAIYDQARRKQQPALDNVVAIIADYTGVPAETIKAGQWPIVSLNGKPDVNYIDEMQKTFVEKGLVPTPADLSKVVNLSLLE